MPADMRSQLARDVDAGSQTMTRPSSSASSAANLKSPAPSPPGCAPGACVRNVRAYLWVLYMGEASNSGKLPRVSQAGRASWDSGTVLNSSIN